MNTMFETVMELAQTTITDPQRLLFHIQPPTGLLNDPNGLVQHKGQYHLFYQWNPWSCEHKNKVWGHVTTKNFVDFTQQPVALLPTDWYDKNGCYSGSGFVKDDHIHLFYTGNVKDEAGNRQSYQCLAKLDENNAVEKLGVVIDDCEIPEGYTRHFRDPKIWFDETSQQWVSIIGAQTTEEQGTALLFNSSDAKNWNFMGELQTEYARQFGYMWECPDLLIVDETDVFIFSPQGLDPIGMEYANIYQSGYLIGDLNLETATMTHGSFRELDRGFEFYAPQTFKDESGRTIMIAWMGLPEEEEQPTCEFGWVHAFTMPRELQVRDGHLHQFPLTEMEALRDLTNMEKHVLEAATQIATTPAYEVLISLENVPTTGSLELVIDETQTFSLDFATQIASVVRTGEYLPGVRRCQLTIADSLELRVFKDTSSIEIFIQDGKEVFTSRTFATQPTALQVVMPSDAHGSLNYWPLQAIQIQK